jgi:hypothetical protein
VELAKDENIRAEEERMNAELTAKALSEKGWWVSTSSSSRRLDELIEGDCIAGEEPDSLLSIGVWTWEGKPNVDRLRPGGPPLCEVSDGGKATLIVLGIPSPSEAWRLLEKHSNICMVGYCVPWEYAVHLATGFVLSEKEAQAIL